jgi:hypothetical protein
MVSRARLTFAGTRRAETSGEDLWPVVQVLVSHQHYRAALEVRGDEPKEEAGSGGADGARRAGTSAGNASDEGHRWGPTAAQAPRFTGIATRRGWYAARIRPERHIIQTSVN